MTEGKFAMVTEWMVRGNINEYVKMEDDVDRLALVSFESIQIRNNFLHYYHYSLWMPQED